MPAIHNPYEFSITKSEDLQALFGSAVRVGGVSDATIDTEFEVPHGIGRMPIGFIVLTQDKAGSFYNSGVTAWDEDSIYLKCSVASVAFTLLVV